MSQGNYLGSWLWTSNTIHRKGRMYLYLRISHPSDKGRDTTFGNFGCNEMLYKKKKELEMQWDFQRSIISPRLILLDLVMNRCVKKGGNLSTIFFGSFVDTFWILSLQSEPTICRIPTYIFDGYKKLCTERQKKLITSSECHSLKSRASTRIIFGHRLGKFILNKHI